MLGIDTRAARWTWTAALVLVSLWLVYRIRATLFIFALAVLFAYLLAPLVDLLDRFLPGRTRTPALALAYAILVGALAFGGGQLGVRVVEEANRLSKELPARIEAWKAASPGGRTALEKYGAELIEKVQTEISKGSTDLLTGLAQAGVKVLAVASGVIYVVIIPILAFFFLKDGREIRRRILELVGGGPRGDLVSDVLADLNVLLAHYMRALMALSLATFTAYGLFFSLLGVPYAILLATLAGLLEVVPMLGPLTACVIVFLVALVSGAHALAVAVFLLAYRCFQDYLLSPHVMGKGMEMHPLLVMFGVYAGAEIGGIAGMVLSVPLLALVRILLLRIRKARAAPAAQPAIR
jgi:predicted PurR-regulated permease PerM